MMAKPEMRFLPLGSRRLAYEVRGDGPVLVAPAWWVSHLELDWQTAGFRTFWQGLADGYTLVRYDRLGVGMSDRTVYESDLTLDAEVATLSALLDELQLERVTLIGGSSGSCTAIAYAAAHPERVDRLLLYGSYADGAELTPPGVADAILGAVRAHWGLGSRLLGDMFLGRADAAQREGFARIQREAATADTAAAVLKMVYTLDVRARLRAVRVSTAVLHRRDDRAVPYRLGCDVAAAIGGATFTPLPGSAHFPWHGDVESVVSACCRSLGAAHATPRADTPPKWARLTDREREVLDCVARGLNDREIAERLVLSPHTVHRHVANIRTKLGGGSRTAAVAEAARRGLLGDDDAPGAEDGAFG
ncbi:alpha/beta fold hydrolase [Mycobacterium yunnanensis]|uniref:Alpha/beta fold hydrolase n=1 Tax=Mycobacterium yunnanensis TaxID=368477 RepID=A0A9X2YI33_9MYCO|nr:alpha/beta fold hydrolase [Mycobacterium yunnanensis]MCV7419773.1 alpha/beta fold hydrolase [Mycobacterium yunnanensis]